MSSCSMPRSVVWAVPRYATFPRVIRVGAYPYAVEERNGKLVSAATGLPVVATDFRVTDLTGCIAALEIRDASTRELRLRLTLGDGLEIDGPAGRIKVVIAAGRLKDATWSTAVFDLLVQHPNGLVRQVIYGSIQLYKGVTEEVSHG